MVPDDRPCFADIGMGGEAPEPARAGCAGLDRSGSGESEFGAAPRARHSEDAATGGHFTVSGPGAVGILPAWSIAECGRMKRTGPGREHFQVGTRSV